MGDILHKETKTITDNDQQQINVSKNIQIKAVLPCPQQHYFYNGTGKIDKNKVKDFLGDQIDKVVGWYKFQKISNLKFSLRDKIVHQQLIELFGFHPDLFTCCFLISEISDNGSTHLFSQVFMRFHNYKYDHLPIYIPNLSESNNIYKTPELASDTFNKLVDELNNDKKTTHGFVVIIKLQDALQKHIDKVINDLGSLEQNLFELEKEVKLLELKKLKKKNDEEKIQLGVPFSNIPFQEDMPLKIKSENEFNSLSSEVSPGKNLTKKNNTKVLGKGRITREGRDSLRGSQIQKDQSI